MKHRELTDHIKGSFLKRQYLEAFLVQGAYIESLLKLTADFTFFKETNASKDAHHKILDATRSTIDKMSLNELINFLFNAGLISKDQKTSLHAYRESRNRMLHNLIQEIKKTTFDDELKSICEKGTAIIEDKTFIEMADLLDYLETPNEKQPETTSHVGTSQPPLHQNAIV